MNLVEQILNGLSDAELKEAMREMKELDTTGVLPSGRVRDIASRLHDEAGLTSHDARSVAQSALYRIAAFRWAGL